MAVRRGASATITVIIDEHAISEPIYAIATINATDANGAASSAGTVHATTTVLLVVNDDAPNASLQLNETAIGANASPTTNDGANAGCIGVIIVVVVDDSTTILPKTRIQQKTASSNSTNEHGSAAASYEYDAADAIDGV